jgi:thymidylate synthase
MNLIFSPNNDYGEKVRPRYETDNFPAHTYYLNHHCETWNVSAGEIPMTGLRKIAWKSAIKEYLWIFQDQSNDLDLLKDKYNITWWDNWDIGDRTIGCRYGATIKKYDLMNKLLEGIKNDPLSRRHIIDMYQYADFEETKGLYPCMFLHQFTVRGKYLDLMTIQRSSDFVVAGDINKVQAIALLFMVAKATGYQPGNFTWIVNNLHLYDRHVEQANELIHRFQELVEKKEKLSMPILKLETDKTDFYSFTIDDFVLENYNPIEGKKLYFELGV